MRTAYLLCFASILSGASLVRAAVPAVAGQWPPWHHRQPFRRFVHYVTYQGDSLPQKRTPPAKLPRYGRVAIAHVEMLLAGGYHALLVSDTAAVLSPAQQDTLWRAWYTVWTHYPQWNNNPYREEFSFYQRVNAQRHLTRLHQRFQQTQGQLASARARAQTQADGFSFNQAVRASQTAQQAQQWAAAEVYLARCLVLRPADLSQRVQHARVTQRCVEEYFACFINRGESWWDQAAQGLHLAGVMKPKQWPGYAQALPQLTAYFDQLGADYSVLWHEGKQMYLHDLVTTYLMTAQWVLPPAETNNYSGQVYAALTAYRACYGPDDTYRVCQQEVRQWQMRAR